MSIEYKMVKGKYVLCKDGVYFSLTLEQLREVNNLITEILVLDKMENLPSFLVE